MAGYIGSKAVNLSTTAANVGGDANIGGDLTVDTSTLHVDSTNNQVGIGTSSPSANSKLQVRVDTDQNIGFNSATGNPRISAFNDAVNTSLDLNFNGATLRYETGGTERMRVDASGRVTKPYQPAFTAQPTSFTGSGGIAGTPTFIFATTLLNIGGHFNTSNGRFTAPVAGNYFFSYSITAASSSKNARYFRVRLKKNGAVVLNPHSTISDETGDADYNLVSAASLVVMNASDYVELEYGSSIDASGLVFYDTMNTFSGFLMS